MWGIKYVHSPHQQHGGGFGFDSVPAAAEDVDGGIEATFVFEVGSNFVGGGAGSGAEDHNAFALVCGLEEALFNAMKKLIALWPRAQRIGFCAGKAIFFIVGLAAGINPYNVVLVVLLHERLPTDMPFAGCIQFCLFTNYAGRGKPSAFHPIQNGAQGQDDKAEANELSEGIFHASVVLACMPCVGKIKPW